MAIQFKVDAILGNATKVTDLINKVNQGATLKIDNKKALDSIKAVQDQVNALKQSMQGLSLGNFGGGGGNGGSSGGGASTGNVATNIGMLPNAMQQIATQYESIKDINGEWVSTTTKIKEGYQEITTTLNANNDIITTTKNNYSAYQKDVDNFNKKNLNGIDYEIRKREQAGRIFSQQLQAQMEVQSRLDALGMNTGHSVNMSGVTDIESLSVALGKSNIGFDANVSSITKMNQKLGDAGDTITTFTVRQKQLTADGAEYWLNTSYAISDADGKLRKMGESHSDIMKNQSRTMAEQIKMQFKQYAVYYAVSSIIQGIVGGISSCVSYTKELNEAMTNIRIVTMDTKEATDALLDNYNQMGQKLGASTTDIAEGAVDWLRQGYSTAEANQLVEGSVVLSKLALIDSAEATEYLTSALKGYKLEASDVIGVIDQLVAIDLKAATSAGDMAEAIKYKCRNIV